MSIRVLETHNGSPAGLRFSTRDDPQPRRGEIVVEVRHTSLNFGESRRSAQNLEPDGSVLGWDASGVVAAIGPDTEAPAIGTRVVTRALRGGWAQKRIARTADVAVVPDSVDLALAATLPTAAVTALGTLQVDGPILGRTVLVTGASGGVGRFAIQLAKLGGARVIASVGSEASAAGLAELGADVVAIGLDGVKEGVDLVVESVGGPQLVQAFDLLNRDGNIQSLGWASQQDAVFGNLGTVGKSGRHIHGYLISEYDVGPLLKPLLGWLAEGRLKIDVTWRGSWENYAAAIETIVGRRLHGKAILDVTS
jgi:NADPH2:quinone reductase